MTWAGNLGSNALLKCLLVLFGCALSRNLSCGFGLRLARRGNWHNSSAGTNPFQSFE